MTKIIDNLRMLELHLLEMENLVKALGVAAAREPALSPLIAQLTTQLDLFQRGFYDLWGDV